MSEETHFICKYCGAKLKYDYLVKNGGMCLYCDNDDCKVKPITEYNYASDDAFKVEVNEITMDKWE
jgi:IS4 transposase